MKIFLTIFLTCLIAFAWGQNAPVKETTVFYNSFSWSPDGTSLCFSVIVMKNGAFDKKLWEIGSINVQTKDVVRITNNTVDDDWPTYSPDGKKLVFQSDRDGSLQIYTMDNSGDHLKRLSDNRHNEFHPDWSPDGKKIMFVSDRDGNQEIYVMKPDGSEHARLTNSPYKEFNPQWSPDGQKIVYYYEKGDQRDQVYIADKDGKNIIKLTSDSTHNYYPAWSADGGKIIYATSGNLWQMNVKEPDKKVELLKGVSYAKYSPDGKKIAFKKGNWPSSEIWICNSDGTNAMLVTDAQKMTGLFSVSLK